MLVSSFPSAYPPFPVDQSLPYSPSAYSPLMDDRSLSAPRSPTTAASSPSSANTSPLLHPSYHTSPPLLPDAAMHVPHDLTALAAYPHSPTAYPLHTPYNSPQPAYAHLTPTVPPPPFNPYYQQPSQHDQLAPPTHLTHHLPTHSTHHHYYHTHSTNPPPHLTTHHMTTSIPPHHTTAGTGLLTSPPPASQRPLRNLHVDNLPPVSEVRLRELFVEWGRIVRVRVVRDETSGTYGGYGFVMYEREEEARAAIEHMDGKLVFSEGRWEGLEDGHEESDKQTDETQSGAAPAAEQSANRHTTTGGSGRSSGESSGSDTPAELASAGEQSDATAATSPTSHSSATNPAGLSPTPQLPPFTPPEDATQNPDGTWSLPSGVLLSPYGQIGKCLRVTLARQKKPPHAVSHALAPITQHSPYQPTVNTNLYIAGLPVSYNKQQLDALFAPFGLIVESRILLDRQTGNSRGVGFVRYETQVSCNAAIRAWNGRRLPDASDQKTGVVGAGGNGASGGAGRAERSSGAITVRYATDRNSAMAVAAAQQAQQAARRAAAQPPPSPLDMQTLLQNLQMHQLYPFLPPLSPVSPPTSPHPYSPYSPPLPLHYQPPSPNPLSPPNPAAPLPSTSPTHPTQPGSIIARIQDITPSLLLRRLPVGYTHDEVWRLCVATCGGVVAVEAGLGVGECVVRMERDEDVAVAVEQLDGLLLAGEDDSGQQLGYQISATKL